MPAQQFDEEVPAELKAVEDALRQLTPSVGQLNRDRLMYLAGQANTAAVGQSLASSMLGVCTFREFAGTQASRWRKRSLVWPFTTVASLLLCCVLGSVLVFKEQSGEPTRLISEQITPPDTAPGDLADSPSTGQEYFRLRNLVLSKGVDALPPSQFENCERDDDIPLTWPAPHGQVF